MDCQIVKSSVVAVSKEQVSCHLAAEAVILNTQDGVYYSLNPCGALIWNLMQTRYIRCPHNPRLVFKWPTYRPLQLVRARIRTYGHTMSVPMTSKSGELAACAEQAKRAVLPSICS